MKFLKFILVFIGFWGTAQETLPIYQQYLLGGKYLINPAHYGETDDVIMHGTYQKQYSKFNESPNVQTIGIHANVADRLGAGLSFFRDQNGAISANGITAGASYFVPLSDEDRKDQFSFGTAVNLYNMNVDTSLLYYKESTDPLVREGVDGIFIAYANLGLQTTYQNFFAGISVLDIPISNDIPIVNGIEPSPTKYILNTGYDWVISEGVSLEPSVLLNLNTNSARILDLNLMGKVYSDTNSFSAGVSFRTAKDRVGGGQLTLSPIIKGQIKRFTFGATYSFGLSDIYTYGGNSFMLSVGYNFENFLNTRGFRLR